MQWHERICLSIALMLVTAVTMLGPGLAANDGVSSESASALERIFVSLDAEGVDMSFGGPITAPLGIAEHGQTVEVRELPPVKTHSTDVAHIFYRLEDGRGYIVVRFTASGFAALRFDEHFDFIVAAVKPNGKPATKLSGPAALNILDRELRDCEAIATRLPTP